ncbi:hypothetical protein KI387_008005 [Taxus chinensis]|uniref:BTB domain-containing protein n=1 Tax=Taxus chinensis TaxID=29808 RepID=A0AA38CPQ7_TAXCH|nr:hypothetical protein KI387_008005 [Taxus chinensis]
MEAWSNNNKGENSGSHFNFSFAFDNSQFSDRVLWIKVMPDSQESMSDRDDCHTTADCEDPPKRIRIYCEAENGKQILTTSNGAALQESNEKAMEMAEEHLSVFTKSNETAMKMVKACPSPIRTTSNEADDGNADNKLYCSLNIDIPTVLRVRTIQVISAVLAAKSVFFYKLFSNGMRESNQRDVTLHVRCSEEEAFMDLLNFIYCGTLNAQTTTALLDVLMVADKFEVPSCFHHCIGALQSLPMTIDSASLFISLPPSVLMVDAVQSLINVAKSFLTKYFSDTQLITEEHMNLPLAVIEEVLSSDKLKVRSEDALYDFVIRWSKKNYPNDEERRYVLTYRLSHLLRFPHMTNKKLKEILSQTDLHCLNALKLVSEALFFKAEPPYKMKSYDLKEIHHKRFFERSYVYRSVRVMKFDKPHTECMVFWDIKKDELTFKLCSEAFYFGNQQFHLLFQPAINSYHPPWFGVAVVSRTKVTFELESEFSVRAKPSNNFVVKVSGPLRFGDKNIARFYNLFSEPWWLIISDYSPYLIDNVFHMRVVLNLRS